jgi:hypothetical protein
MSKSPFANYIPIGLDSQRHWINKFTDAFMSEKARFTTISADDLAALIARRSAINAGSDAVADIRAFSASVTKYIHALYKGDPYGDSRTLLPFPTLNTLSFPSGPTPGGTLSWLVKVFIPKLLADPGWQDTLAPQFGLVRIGGGGDVLEYHDFNPSVSKTPDGKHLQIKGRKGPFDSIQILRRINSEGDLFQTDVATTLPWTDPKPLTEIPETREYQLIGRLKNQPQGAPSGIFYIIARSTEKITKESV